jgi:hypothetical protein
MNHVARCRMRALSSLCFVALVSGCTGAQGDVSDSVLAGTWAMNVARSKAPAWKSKVYESAPKPEMLHIEAAGGQTHAVKYTETGTHADGSPIEVTFDGKADGKPYPLTSSNGQEIATIILRRQSSHHYAEDESLSDGTKASLTWTIAPNGKVMTIQAHSTRPDDHDETTVWDKQP